MTVSQRQYCGVHTRGDTRNKRNIGAKARQKIISDAQAFSLQVESLQSNAEGNDEENEDPVLRKVNEMKQFMEGVNLDNILRGRIPMASSGDLNLPYCIILKGNIRHC